jgi:signal transduction histidine kinase
MRGLLDFARQSRVVKTPTDLGRLVQELADSMNLKLDQSKVRVKCGISPSLPRLMLDADQVRQMLVNLVQNGLDAVEEMARTDGSGEVVISAGLSATGDLALLRVSDNGCGMPPEVVKEIFTPFYTTKQLGKGTGMGLSIVYGVVKMHAGDITVDSVPGQGTSFRVRIPIDRKSTEEISELSKNSTAG